ncbi:aspartate/glutamate racemase family protein [Prosthecodimorpha staleyi]|uniref:Aspartate/glutamate racemase family protein n=1 Tax=Prosthecodimorpha staleyi TaxID=2840188 RepID=A0A947D3D6_9HYPH|nr:aspartate/glutamate racemase family protein [Prosthecodimorpha staleyi]MBT9290011.1 aspartate/glutamate racemase family protein [Prosthecodimorpha staleyi]
MTMTRQKTYYGVSVGILMVRSYFQRFVGDIGNALTWDFPVQYKIVHDATPARMTDLHNVDLLDAFKKAAQELIDSGVDGITTTCGFLSIYQKELAEFCTVPVATSSLLQVPMVQRLIPARKKVGILTYSAASLNGRYFEGVGVDPATPVAGMPADSEFVRSIRDGDDTVPFEVLKEEVLAATGRLLEREPEIGAIVSECTNLTPYSADIVARFGVPVYDAVTLVNWFHGGLRPRRFVQS